MKVSESAESLLPRIWWCPTGPLAFLPLHAAGLHDSDEPGTKIFDYVVSSYLPTITTQLSRNVSSASQKPFELLAVVPVEYSNESSLPQSEHELAIVKHHVG